MHLGTASVAARTAGHYTAAYERLRTQVRGGALRGAIDQPAGGATGGLGLILQEGVPGWLGALERLGLATIGPAHRKAAGAAPRAASPAHGEVLLLPAIGAPLRLPDELLPIARYPDLTRLMASLVLSRCWPRTASPACQPATHGAVPCR